MFIENKKHHKTKQEFKKISGITGKVKKFNQEKCDKYDVKARNIIKNIFGDLIKDNEDIYGEDMIFTQKNFPYKYLELQVCSYWEDTFPYEYPFVYARKMKFSKKTLFLTFNKYYTKCIIFGREHVSENSGRLKKYDRECVNFVQWGKTMEIITADLSLNSIRRYSGEYIESEESEENINDVDIE